jgi:transcriptional regulator with XRE-family HTH domain
MERAHQDLSFEAAVRRKLSDRRMTVTALAGRMGASPQALSRILARDNPRMATVLRVAHALGCDPRELVP